jgi:hypothetical protein
VIRRPNALFHFFELGQLIHARLEFVQKARALPPGTERNQKRQIAQSLKRLIENQSQGRDNLPRLVSSH